MACASADQRSALPSLFRSFLHRSDIACDYAQPRPTPDPARTVRPRL